MQKNEFVRINFTAKVKDTGQIFDRGDSVPIVTGAGFVISGLDRVIMEMEPGEKKTVELSPEEAFGNRNPGLVRPIPLSEFKRHGIEPKPGMVVTADNLRGRVLSVDSGRVKVDFNHPLAGKTVVYEVEVTERIESPEEKLASLVEYYTRLKPESVEIKEGVANVAVQPGIPPGIKSRIASDALRFLGIPEVRFIESFRPEEPSESGSSEKDRTPEHQD